MPGNSSEKGAANILDLDCACCFFLSKGIYFLLPFFSLAPKSFALFLLPDSIRRRAEGEKKAPLSSFFLPPPINRSPKVLLPLEARKKGGGGGGGGTRLPKKWAGKGRRKEKTKGTLFHPCRIYIKEWKLEKKEIDRSRVFRRACFVVFSPFLCENLQTLPMSCRRRVVCLGVFQKNHASLFALAVAWRCVTNSQRKTHIAKATRYYLITREKERNRNRGKAEGEGGGRHVTTQANPPSLPPSSASKVALWRRRNGGGSTAAITVMKGRRKERWGLVRRGFIQKEEPFPSSAFLYQSYQASPPVVVSPLLRRVFVVQYYCFIIFSVFPFRKKVSCFSFPPFFSASRMGLSVGERLLQF